MDPRTLAGADTPMRQPSAIVLASPAALARRGWFAIGLAAVLVLSELAAAPNLMASSLDANPTDGIPLFSRVPASSDWRIRAQGLSRLSSGEPTQIRLAVPVGRARVLQLALTSRASSNRLTFVGEVAGVPGSRATLAVCDSAVAGSIRIPGDADYVILPGAQGRHRIERIDATSGFHCGVAEAVAPEYPVAPRRGIGLQGPLPGPSNPGGDGPAILDLLVVYTATARAAAGGVSGITAQVDAAVADANQVFSNSGVSAGIGSVTLAEIDYAETGRPEEDLANLTEAAEHDRELWDEHDEEDPADDHDWQGLKVVPELRRNARADLVCLVVESGAGTAGVANQMGVASTQFAWQALSVIRRTFLNRYEILAHELGHNLGCQHERSAASGPGLFPYSYGYRFQLADTWYRTVMATGPGITIPYFSNPLVNYLGVPTGVPADQPGAADNARTLSITAPLAARFDEALTPPPPSVRLLRPATSSAIGIPAELELEAELDGGSRGAEVAFYAGELRLGSVTRPPYRMSWTNSVAGEFQLWAKATAPDGSISRSAAVTVRFSRPPNVALTSPAHDGWAPRGAALTCSALASDPDGGVKKVEFFADEYLIGVAWASPFSIAWTNLWADRYVMTARATDDAGVSTTSAPVVLNFAPPSPAFDLTAIHSREDGSVQLQLAGPAGQSRQLEVSDDLLTWRLLASVELEMEPVRVIDPGAAGVPSRFYRLRPPPSPVQGKTETR